VKFTYSFVAGGERFEGSVEVKLPASLSEAEEMWGNLLTFMLLMEHVEEQLLATCKKLKDKELIEEAFRDWKPQLKKQKSSIKRLAKELARRYSEEELQKKVEALKSSS